MLRRVNTGPTWVDAVCVESGPKPPGEPRSGSGHRHASVGVCHSAIVVVIISKEDAALSVYNVSAQQVYGGIDDTVQRAARGEGGW